MKKAVTITIDENVLTELRKQCTADIGLSRLINSILKDYLNQNKPVNVIKDCEEPKQLLNQTKTSDDIDFDLDLDIFMELDDEELNEGIKTTDMTTERITITIDSEILKQIKERAGSASISSYIGRTMRESLNSSDTPDKQREAVKLLYYIADKECKQYNEEHPDNPMVGYSSCSLINDKAQVKKELYEQILTIIEENRDKLL